MEPNSSEEEEKEGESIIESDEETLQYERRNRAIRWKGRKGGSENVMTKAKTLREEGQWVVVDLFF